MTIPFLPGFTPPPLLPVHHPLLRERGISLRVLRLDLVHAEIDGNKWFKLRHNLPAILASARPVLSFGGAWSNHLRCLAAAGAVFGFSSIGIIRGELTLPLNPVLAEASRNGMTLVAVSRSEYRRRHHADYQEQLRKRFGAGLVLPEGASNATAVRGCREICDFLHWPGPGAATRYLLLPAATGATLAGVLAGLPPAPPVTVLGVGVLRAPGYLRGEVEHWLADYPPVTHPWRIEEDFHCGGYARRSAGLLDFMADFSGESLVPLEPVYSGKLFYALWQLVEDGGIASGSEVIAIHTGGLRGTPAT